MALEAMTKVVALPSVLLQYKSSIVVLAARVESLERWLDGMARKMQVSEHSALLLEQMVVASWAVQPTIEAASTGELALDDSQMLERMALLLVQKVVVLWAARSVIEAASTVELA